MDRCTAGIGWSHHLLCQGAAEDALSPSKLEPSQCDHPWHIWTTVLCPDEERGHVSLRACDVSNSVKVSQPGPFRRVALGASTLYLCYQQALSRILSDLEVSACAAMCPWILWPGLQAFVARGTAVLRCTRRCAHRSKQAQHGSARDRRNRRV